MALLLKQRLASFGHVGVAGVLACLLLTACGPASASRPAASLPNQGSGVASDDPGVKIGPANPAQQLTLSFGLATRDSGAPAFGQALSSPDYMRLYGPSPAERAQVVQWLMAHGFTITSASANSLLVEARGSATQVEHSFGVALSNYRLKDGRVYHAADRAAAIPAELRSAIIDIQGLSNRPLLHPLGQRASSANPMPQLLGPTELESAYGFKSLHDQGLHGEGQTIAFAEIDTFKQSDIDFYDTTYSLSAQPVENVPVDGGADQAKQVSETTLDIEVVHAIAPKAKLLAYGGPSDFGSLLKIFDKIISDNRAQVVSVSLGGCEPLLAEDSNYGTSFLNELTTEFQRAAQQGMTVFVSSGDDGAYSCRRNDPSLAGELAASLPAANPYVTAVGGTALFLDNGAYSREAGWEAPLSGSGGGGGLSVAYPRPSWQTGPGVDNGQSTGKRQVPDVAAAADPMTGYKIYDSTGISCQDDGNGGNTCWGAVGGTSAASPLWGALALLANQYAASHGKQRLGFINPKLYQLAASGTEGLHDVTQGGNLYYQCTPGWDYSTGLGTPNAGVLVPQLVG